LFCTRIMIERIAGVLRNGAKAGSRRTAVGAARPSSAE